MNKDFSGSPAAADVGKEKSAAQIVRRNQELRALAGDGHSLREYLMAAEDITDLVERTARLLRAIGVSHFSHYMGNCPADALDAVGKNLSNIKEAYTRNSFYLDDIALLTTLEINTPFFRSSVDEYILSWPFDSSRVRNHRYCVEYLRANGVYDSYFYPIVEENYRAIFMVMSIGMPSEQFQMLVDKHGADIAALADAFDDVGREKHKSKFHGLNNNPNVILQPRVREILQLMADKDLRQEEVARLLNIHTITVNKHMAAAKKALSTYTIHGTILAAKEAGLIS